MAEACIFQFGLPVKGMEEEGEGDTRMKPMTLRLPDEDWVTVLKIHAACDGRSFHGHMIWLLREATEEREHHDNMTGKTMVIPDMDRAFGVSGPMVATSVPLDSKKRGK